MLNLPDPTTRQHGGAEPSPLPPFAFYGLRRAFASRTHLRDGTTSAPLWRAALPSLRSHRDCTHSVSSVVRAAYARTTGPLRSTTNGASRVPGKGSLGDRRDEGEACLRRQGSASAFYGVRRHSAALPSLRSHRGCTHPVSSMPSVVRTFHSRTTWLVRSTGSRDEGITGPPRSTASRAWGISRDGRQRSASGRSAGLSRIMSTSSAKLDFPPSLAKSNTSNFLIDNFGALVVRRPPQQLVYPDAGMAAKADCAPSFEPPASGNSNRQCPELETDLSHRKQRTEFFLIAKFRPMLPQMLSPISLRPGKWHSMGQDVDSLESLHPQSGDSRGPIRYNGSSGLSGDCFSLRNMHGSGYRQSA